MSSDRADEEFMKVGFQYYVAARASAMAKLLPVCGNLYHHAIEMLLKAGLSRSTSLRDLQRSYGHKLPDIWTAFKTQFATSGDLDKFDATIANLEAFEDIRYPDKVITLGAQMILEWSGTPPAGTFGSSSPMYKLSVNEIDRLVAIIFKVSSRNPLFFSTMLAGYDFTRNVIEDANPVAAELLPPRQTTVRSQARPETGLICSAFQRLFRQR